MTAQLKNSNAQSHFIIPPRHSRTIIVGKTGSGKTTLARKFLSQFPNVAIHDAKGLINWRGYRKCTKIAELIKYQQDERLVYSPIAKELKDPDYANAFFELCYQGGNRTVYVDEVFGVGYGQEISDGYHACLTRGRERGITLFSSTQRPLSIPPVVKSEAEFWYVFTILLEQDKRAIKNTIGIKPEQIDSLEMYAFYQGTINGTSGPYRLKIP